MTTQPKNKFKIAHSLEQLEDQLILTLKDKPLLKNNKEIDEEDDLLENQQLQAQNRTRHNTQLKKKIKELTDVTTSHLQTKQEGKGDILPHYNDHSYKNQEIQFEEGGIIKNKKPKAFKNTQSDFLSNQESNTTKVAQQYLYSFKIKKANKNTLHNQKNKSDDLLGFLNETAEDKVFQQDNTMKRSAENAISDALDSIRKKRITEYNAKKQVQSVDISSIIGRTEEEQLLNKSIQKAQKRNIQKTNFLEAIKEEENSQAEQNHNSNKYKTVEIQLNPISYRGDDKKYIRKDFDINGFKSGTSSAMFVKLPSERLAKKEEKQTLPETFKDISPQQLQKMRQQVSFLQDKSLGTGLSSALQFLRQNSLLNQQAEVGRTTDKSSNNINDPSDRVKLEYRNESGKLMKPKQAFRYLCATFHGQGPSNNKVQKRKKRELEQMKMKSQGNTDGKLLKMLEQHQRKSNQAYMVIDLGKKAAMNQNNNG